MDDGNTVLKIPAVEQFFEEILGEEGRRIIKTLIGKEATDEGIAEKLGLKINVVRKILYKLYDYRLASYVRTKDKDIGWYIYTWKLDLPRVQDVIKEKRMKVLDDLSNKLDYELNTVFFECVNDRFRIPYDIASERGFRCPQCEGTLMYTNNDEVVETLETEIKKLNNELKSTVQGSIKTPRMQ